jgi:hypothetical protein
MTNKELLSRTIPVIHETVPATPAGTAKPGLLGGLKKVWSDIRGEERKAFTPDPAADIISQIADKKIAAIVSKLHYRTPQSLKAMRLTCQECFMLPDDCPYYDYSIFDVKKAIKRLMAQPENIRGEIVIELQKVNHELAYHLHEYLEE